MTDEVERIARRHGLTGTPTRLAIEGRINHAWRVGDHIVRIVRQPQWDDSVERERVAVTAARAAGVATPALIAVDHDPEVAARPYTIYEWADGDHLGRRDPGPALDPLFRELGRQLARLHAVPVPDAELATLRRSALPDPARLAAQALAAGAIDEESARGITRTAAELEPRLGELTRPVLLHRDLHPWNVLVRPSSASLSAILDFGDAGFGDPALDFSVMPLFALPAMLSGYREASGVVDDGFTARLRFHGLTVALWELRFRAADLDRRWWRLPPGGWTDLLAP